VSDHHDAKTRTLSPPVLLLCLGGAVVLWGTSFPATKIALEGFPPMALIFLRMVVAVALLLPFVRRIPKTAYRKGDWKWLVLVGLFEPCLYFMFEVNALRFTTASQAGVISAMAPLLVAVGAWFFLREHLSSRAIAGLVLSLLGVAILSLGARTFETAPNPLLGNALELTAMVCAAGYFIVQRHLTSRYDPWLVTGVMSLSGLIFFLPGALLTHPSTWLAASPRSWLAVGYLGAFVTLGAIGLYNLAASQMPAARAAISINLVPFAAVASSWLLLGEQLTPLQVAGGLVIVGGVFLGESRARPAERLAEEPALEEA
jgi:drug/metabolite transporter (DMT)-like permease